MSAIQDSQLAIQPPSMPASLWQAATVAGTRSTTEYVNFSPQQLLQQLKQRQEDAEYPYQQMLARLQDTIDFCKKQLNSYGSV
jgi:hypothetical protein